MVLQTGCSKRYARILPLKNGFWLKLCLHMRTILVYIIGSFVPHGDAYGLRQQ